MSVKTANETELDLGPADRIVDEMNDDGGVSVDRLIPLLQRLQDEYGYLPPPVLVHVSERTGIPTSHMYGVITFYAQFHVKPRGKHTVTVCRGTSCHVSGSEQLLETVRDVLGIEEGETTADMLFSLETVACLGSCALSPVMVVDGKYYGRLTSRRAERILRHLMHEKNRKED